jgi:hypothetical protein
MPLTWPGVPCRFMHERAPTHAGASAGRGRREAYGRTPCTQLAHFEHQSRVPSYIRRAGVERCEVGARSNPSYVLQFDEARQAWIASRRQRQTASRDWWPRRMHLYCGHVRTFHSPIHLGRNPAALVTRLTKNGPALGCSGNLSGRYSMVGRNVRS